GLQTSLMLEFIEVSFFMGTDPSTFMLTYRLDNHARVRQGNAPRRRTGKSYGESRNLVDAAASRVAEDPVEERADEEVPAHPRGSRGRAFAQGQSRRAGQVLAPTPTQISERRTAIPALGPRLGVRRAATPYVRPVISSCWWKTTSPEVLP